MPIEPLSAFEAILASEPFSTIEPVATLEPLSAIEPVATIEPVEPVPTIEPVPAVLSEPIVAAPAPAIAAAPAAIVTPDEISTRPFVSAEGYAKFEQRAKRRRVDRRIEAARQAIDSKRLKQAAAALDEVIELVRAHRGVRSTAPLRGRRGASWSMARRRRRLRGDGVWRDVAPGVVVAAVAFDDCGRAAARRANHERAGRSRAGGDDG
jgi:hypothetical protein